MAKEVEPARLASNGIWNVFSGKKSYTILCGECEFTWKAKVPFELSDKAMARCPSCGRMNSWSHSEWAQVYEKGLKSKI